MVRDNALAVSGLLSPRIGGPTVKPYQPAGYWDFLNFPKRQWQDDHGESQYRRGLYTFWQRTFLHPSLLAFDASTREECTVERPRSNTPLQALVLLNDPTYVEASRVFAGRIVREGGRTEAERLRYAYRRAIQREPTAAEAELLTQALSSAPGPIPGRSSGRRRAVEGRRCQAARGRRSRPNWPPGPRWPGSC